MYVATQTSLWRTKANAVLYANQQNVKCGNDKLKIYEQNKVLQKERNGHHLLG